jgi:hypothetical protein
MMGSNLPSEVTLFAGDADADCVAASLVEAGLTFARPGAERGAAEIVELFVVATPSIGMLALLFEKLRRMRLSRVYIQPGAAEPVWHDLEHRDGRMFYLPPEGPPIEIRDPELSIDALLKLLRREAPPDDP